MGIGVSAPSELASVVDSFIYLKKSTPPQNRQLSQLSQIEIVSRQTFCGVVDFPKLSDKYKSSDKLACGWALFLRRLRSQNMFTLTLPLSGPQNDFVEIPAVDHARTLHWYLAHKKPQPPRILQQAYA